ncbi:MAG TPA: ABC transporter permease [Cyclobacteriaceae bacterium]|jgi:ABC-type antimicrobial peptide transport system permease subunit|nr:ABC transporter permease [Cyclobacteriaceae bacterium]
MKKSNPPQLPLRFFRWFCHPKLRDHIEGDLMELYVERVKEFGKKKADRKFVIDVLLLFRKGIIKPTEGYKKLNTYGMYKSYFKIGWRNLLNNKGYSIINIGGLAAGMAIAVLIGLWVWDELSFNKYHQNYDRLAQVLQHQTVDGKVMTQYAIPRPLEFAMRTTYGNDFTYLAMSTWTDDNILGWGEKKISQTGNFAQADFPEMISLKMVSGTRNGLKDPASIMLSASAAKALFGSTDPLNQIMRVRNRYDVKVTGVYEDLPYNSHFKELKFISSWELYAASEEWMKRAENTWDSNSFQLFAQLAPGADMNWVSEKIKPVRAIHSKDNKFKPEIFLHPMSDWNLRSDWNNGVKTGGRIEIVWMFGIIGLFVLLLACINFMNLTTARSEKRAKEVGIRMTMGSVRSQLIKQFLSETFLVVLLGFVLAIFLVELSLPWFNNLSGKQIVVDWSNPILWMSVVAFILITSLLAGSYPAFFLSSFRPVQVLKSAFKAGRNASLPRKVLVAFQFTISISLVICTLVIYDQIQYSKNRPIGYDRDGLIMIQVKSYDFVGKHEALRLALKNTGAVVEVAESSSPMTEVWNNSSTFNWPGRDPDLQSSDFGLINVSHEYGATIGWSIKEGRDFSHDFPSDSTAIILNEAAVKYIGVKDPIGMEITRKGKKFHVIGIAKDVIMESPYREARHYIYSIDNNLDAANWINIKLNPQRSPSESIAAVESVVKKFAPSVPFDFKFADEEYGNKFSSEERVGKLSYVFAGLAALISCLGLIGLSSFVAEQHVKEIGIRKVLGASLLQLWGMLSSGFFVLILISSAVAAPIAWYLMSRWLQKYQYRIDISWQTIVVSVIGALVVTTITVSYQTIKAAMANPVNSLRSE